LFVSDLLHHQATGSTQTCSLSRGLEPRPASGYRAVIQINAEGPMAKTPDTTTPSTTDQAGYLDMPEDRRAAAKAHVALVSATVRKAAIDTPIFADVDDFRRVLVAGAKS
jgi:hypothetical protein